MLKSVGDHVPSLYNNYHQLMLLIHGLEDMHAAIMMFHAFV